MSGEHPNPRADVWTVTGERPPYLNEERRPVVYDVAVCRTRERALEIKAEVEAEGHRAWISSWKYDTKGGAYRGEDA